VSLLRRLTGDDAPDESGLRTDAGMQDAYEAHAGELYAVAHRSLGDRGLAQEAVQETFVRAWRAAHRFDPQLGMLRGWLFSILRNVIIDLQRKRARRFNVIGSGAGDGQVEAIDKDDRFDKVLNHWVMEQAMASNGHPCRTPRGPFVC
jgi:RNA polymerase sigma-70 factor, ECF subfamily